MATELHFHLYKKEGNFTAFLIDDTVYPENEKQYHTPFKYLNPFFDVIAGGKPKHFDNPIEMLASEASFEVLKKIEQRIAELKAMMPENSTQDFVIKLRYDFDLTLE